MLRLILIVADQELRNQLRDSTVLAMAILFPLLVLPLSLWLSFSIGQLVQGDLDENPPRIAASGPEEDLAFVFQDSDIVRVEAVEMAPEDAIGEQGVDAVLLLNATGETRAATLHSDNNNARSLAARSSVRGRLDALRERRVQALAAAAGLDRDALKPRAVASEDSDSEQIVHDARRFFGAGVAYFLLMLCGFGLFYPAVDIVVGERERGTLETTLATGVPRVALLTGKLLTIVALALFTGVAGCAALTLSLTNLLQTTTEKSVSAWLAEMDLSLLPHPLALLVVPLATLSFLALLTALLVLCMLPARTFKSAQNLGTLPLYLGLMVPLGAVLPVKLGPAMALVPLLNNALMIRDVFAADAMAWGAIALGLGVNAALSFGLFTIALRIYTDERFLFGGWLPQWMVRLLGTEGAS